MRLDLALFFEFQQLQATALCVVCGGVLVNPLRITGCGHYCCKDCLLNTQLRECPADFCDVSPLYCEPAVDKENELHFIRMRCPVHGCCWFGNYGDFQFHRNNHCLQLLYPPFASIPSTPMNAASGSSLAPSILSQNPTVDQMRQAIMERFPVDAIGLVDLRYDFDSMRNDFVINFYNAYYTSPGIKFIRLNYSATSGFDVDSIMNHLVKTVNRHTKVLEALMSVPSDDENGGGVYQAFSLKSLPLIMGWIFDKAKEVLSEPLVFSDIGCGLNWPCLFWSLISGRPSFGIEIDCQRLYLAASAMLQLNDSGLTKNVHVGLFKGDVTQPMDYSDVNVFLFWDRGEFDCCFCS